MSGEIDHAGRAEKYDRIDQKLGEALTELGTLWIFSYEATHIRQMIGDARELTRAEAQRQRQFSDRTES